MIENDFDFIQAVNKLEFRFAKTRSAVNPHEYVWAEDKKTLEVVRQLNKYVQEHGEEQNYFGEIYPVLFIDGHKYWCMEDWSNTQILNRNWDFKNEDGTINTSITEGKKEC